MDAFLQTLDPRRQTLDAGLWIGRGQCIEHYGTGEAYLPLLTALGRLCREPEGAQLVAVLKQYAPTWLVQLPSLLTTEEATALQGKTAGATRARMLRELAEAIEEMATKRPLVLWLEDLHWSDVSTLDWLAFIARRREHARLLVIGTYRPVEVLTHEHPLKAVKQELHLHGQCQELAVEFLRAEHVAEYLVRRFAVAAQSHAPFHRLARAIHDRTDGNPLFMVNMVDQLMSQDVFVEVDEHWTVQKEEDAIGAVPESLRQMIEQQVERLGAEERRMLEAASVAGVEFSAAAIAAGVETEPDAVEEQCTRLARREQFLRLAGTTEWPDGTVAARYSFLHALYQEVLYERVTTGRRVQLHHRIGEREEQAYGERTREIAAELAMHFERGRDIPKAVHHHGQAGQQALQRSAPQEVISHLTTALELLTALPDTPARAQQELALQMALGPALMGVKGYGAPEVEQAYARAQELCQQLGEPLQFLPVLHGLLLYYHSRGKLGTALELETQLRHLAQRHQDPILLAEVHFASGVLLFLQGQLAPARAALERCLAVYEPQQASAHVSRYGQDPGVAAGVLAAFVCWLRGYPEQALRQAQAALTLAQELSHPYSLGFTFFWAAHLYQCRGEAQAVQAYGEELMRLAQEFEFAIGSVHGMILQGWALAERGQMEEGVTRIREGLAGARAIGVEAGRTYFLAVLAEAHRKGGQAEGGLSVLAEARAQVDRTGERFYEAELYRLKGELLLAQEIKSQNSKVKAQKSRVPNPQSQILDPNSEAEACFLKAIEIAQRQQAKSWELRATTSLARLWQQQGKTAEAHQMLSEIYHWFTEGFDTKDLQEAKALLEELT